MKKTILVFFGFDILALDLFTKYLAVNYLSKPIQIISNILSFQYHKNTGLAFSIPLPIVLQILLSLILLALLFLYARNKIGHPFEIFCVTGIISGAFGNLIERIAFGAVTDFIAVWKFPVFNLADTAIFLGVVGLLISEMRDKEKISK